MLFGSFRKILIFNTKTIKFDEHQQQMNVKRVNSTYNKFGSTGSIETHEKGKLPKIALRYHTGKYGWQIQPENILPRTLSFYHDYASKYFNSSPQP